MPCNLAISITKAAVSNEQLLKLLTPELISQAVKSFLSRHETYQHQRYDDWQYRNSLIIYVGECTVTFTDGEVKVEGPEWSTALVNALSADMTTLLSRLADYLFAQQVQQALASLGQVASQTVNVDDQGVTRQATVLSFNL